MSIPNCLGKAQHKKSKFHVISPRRAMLRLYLPLLSGGVVDPPFGMDTNASKQTPNYQKEPISNYHTRL